MSQLYYRVEMYLDYLFYLALLAILFQEAMK